MPVSVSGMDVTREDLSWDTEPFCIWSLVQIRTSLAGIESPYHLVTQMNSSRWTGALITVGALIDWGAKAEWKEKFIMEKVCVPCFAHALWMEKFNSSALLMCHTAQTMGTPMLKIKARIFMWVNPFQSQDPPHVGSACPALLLCRLLKGCETTGAVFSHR